MAVWWLSVDEVLGPLLGLHRHTGGMRGGGAASVPRRQRRPPCGGVLGGATRTCTTSKMEVDTNSVCRNVSDLDLLFP